MTNSRPMTMPCDARPAPHVRLGAAHIATVAIAVALAVANAGTASAAAWPTDPTGLSHAVATAYEAEEHGVVAFDVTMNNVIRGGIMHREDQDSTAFVAVDGKLAHKVVLRHVEGGRADDGAGLAKLSAEPETPLSRFGMRLPCDPGALSEYAFEAPQTQGGTIVLPFRAKVRDQAHGDGKIVLDASGARIASIAFAPTVPPARASAAMVDLTFGALGGGRYGITKIVRSFDGHVGPVHGNVTSTALYGNVRVFASPAAATDAIDHEK